MIGQLLFCCQVILSVLFGPFGMALGQLLQINITDFGDQYH